MFNIRKTKKEDLDEAMKILSIKELGWDNGETYSHKYFERIMNSEEGAIFLVAEESNEILGVIYGEYSQHEDWSELMGISVKENHKGKGIGKALIQKFEDMVKSKNISMVELNAHIETLGKFVHKLGYEKGGTYINCKKILK